MPACLPNVTQTRVSQPTLLVLSVSISLSLFFAAGNEQHDKDSLNETGSTTGGTVEGVPGGAPSRGDRTKDNEQPAAQASTSSAQPARSLVSRILARTRSSNDLLDHSEP